MTRYLAGQHHPVEALGPRVAYVAEEGDGMVGYIAGHLTRRFGCDGELQWIVVDPERRGRGTADALLRRLAGWFVAEGARRVCVDVLPSNRRARRFYARHGARPVDDRWMEWADIGVVLSSSPWSAPGWGAIRPPDADPPQAGALS